MKKSVLLILTAVLVCLVLQGCQESRISKSQISTERASAGRPFEGRKITQIGILVEDAEQSAKLYAALFGMDVPDIVLTDPVEISKAQYNGKKTTAQAKLAFFKFENTTIELIQPVGGPSTWKECLDRNGPGVHHIAFDVKGMDDYIELLDKKGARLVQRGEWAAYTGGQYSYVDTTPHLGVMLELLENY
jgi:methylmalonyl-CoA/ethylmalonyl-CoA epimerase